MALLRVVAGAGRVVSRIGAGIGKASEATVRAGLKNSSVRRASTQVSGFSERALATVFGSSERVDGLRSFKIDPQRIATQLQGWGFIKESGESVPGLGAAPSQSREMDAAQLSDIISTLIHRQMRELASPETVETADSLPPQVMRGDALYVGPGVDPFLGTLPHAQSVTYFEGSEAAAQVLEPTLSTEEILVRAYLNKQTIDALSEGDRYDSLYTLNAMPAATIRETVDMFGTWAGILKPNAPVLIMRTDAVTFLDPVEINGQLQPNGWTYRTNQELGFLQNMMANEMHAHPRFNVQQAAMVEDPNPNSAYRASAIVAIANPSN